MAKLGTQEMTDLVSSDYFKPEEGNVYKVFVFDEDYNSEEKEMLRKLKKVFLMVAGTGVQKFGPQLEEHQQILIDASNILIEIYMAESAILRTEKNAKRFGEDNQIEQTCD